MQLIVYYVIFMIAGDLAAYFIGLFTEREFGGQISLIVFLTLYFLFLWISWILAVRVTAPKDIELDDRFHETDHIGYHHRFLVNRHFTATS
jgi:membrane protein implicated in regulation of membrane protease activity